MNKSILATVASALVCSLGAASAMAGGPVLREAPRVTVHYSDLDLQTTAGQQALVLRLEQAARSVCPGKSSRDLEKWMAGRRCVQQAVERAKAGISEQQIARAAAASKEDRG